MFTPFIHGRTLVSNTKIYLVFGAGVEPPVLRYAPGLLTTQELDVDCSGPVTPMLMKL